MTRLSLELKKEIVNQINNGTSINKISQFLGVYKSTIYYYYKKVKGKRYAPPYVKPNFSGTEGEIVGIFAGDGSQFLVKKRGHYQVTIHFGGHNTIYAEYVRQLYHDYFNKNFRLAKSNDGTIRLLIYSKDIFYYFKNYIEYNPKIKHCTVRLRSINIPLKFKLGFIKGLVDTDGSVLYDRHDKAVRIFYYTTSKELAKQISLILQELSITHTCICRDKINRKPLYVIRITKKEVNKFLNIIKPFKEKLLKGPVVQW
ncbi:LAGLIDADG family homing endonuclease [Candidatus Woesearchaeota archaeon]|nr:LAGLIDADG family homing endonuclease [Candidatus Woesearchaeota archaeon]